MPNSNRIRAQCVLTSVRRSGLVRRPAGDVASEQAGGREEKLVGRVGQSNGSFRINVRVPRDMVRVPAAGTGADLLFTAADARNGGDADDRGVGHRAAVRAAARGSRPARRWPRCSAPAGPRVTARSSRSSRPRPGIPRSGSGGSGRRAPRENGRLVGQHRAGAGARRLPRGRRARRGQRRLPQPAGPERDRRAGGRPGRQDGVTAAAPGLAAAAPALADQVIEG